MRLDDMKSHFRGNPYDQHADLIESRAERYVSFTLNPAEENEGCKKSRSDTHER